jgi:hypothetical protein
MEDTTLLRLLRDLFASKDEKPKDIGPVELALTARLLLQQADERPAYPSVGTLALELGCSERTVDRAVDVLSKAGWVSKETGAGRWQPNKYFVLLSALPVHVDLRTPSVSEDAKTLATHFLKLQRQWQPKRSFRKGTEQRYSYRFQTLLKKCDGSKFLLVEILNFALQHPLFTAHAHAGPHKLRKVWRSLEKAYRESEKTKKEQAA